MKPTKSSALTRSTTAKPCLQTDILNEIRCLDESILLSRSLTWIEERGPGFPRVKNIDFRMDACTLTHIPAAPRGAVGLFMQDSVLFSAKLLGQVSPDQMQKEKLRVLHCLELAERIRELSQS